MGKDSKTFSAY